MNTQQWFDQEIAPELRRLAVDGHAPGRGIWNAHRAEHLPTMQVVLSRMGLRRPAQLAEAAGLKPPSAAARNRGPRHRWPDVVPPCNHGDDDPGLAYISREVKQRQIVRGDTVIVRTRTTYVLR